MVKNNFLPRKIMSSVLDWMDRSEFIAIKGPRQSGKTTLLKILGDKLVDQKGIRPDDLHTYNFESGRERGSFEDDPLNFVRQTTNLASGRRQYLFLDEYQYVEDGGQKLKLVYDTFAPELKVVITGSSSLELTFQLGKYLVGRVSSFYLFPLSLGEFLQTRNLKAHRIWEKRNQTVSAFLFAEGDVPNVADLKDVFWEDTRLLWEEYATFGGYPAVVAAEDRETKKRLLTDIYDTYINRDVIGLLGEGNTRAFRNLVRILAAQTGQLLNYQQLSSDTGLYHQRVKHFLSVLEETFIIKQLSPLHGNLTTELKKNPKSYFLDAGLRNVLLDNFSELEFRADKGELVESVVISNTVYGVGPLTDLLFWRTAGGAELDLVIRRGEKIYPLEVKYRLMNRPSLSKGLHSFIDVYRPRRLVVLTKDYWGIEEVKNTQVLFCPVPYFTEPRVA